MKLFLLLIICIFCAGYGLHGQIIPPEIEVRFQRNFHCHGTFLELGLSDITQSDYLLTKSVILKGKRVSFYYVSLPMLSRLPDSEQDITFDIKSACNFKKEFIPKENTRLFKIMSDCHVIDSLNCLGDDVSNWFNSFLYLDKVFKVENEDNIFLITYWNNYNPNGSTSEAKLVTILVFDKQLNFITNLSYLDCLSGYLKSIDVSASELRIAYFDSISNENGRDEYWFRIASLRHDFLRDSINADKLKGSLLNIK